MQRRLNGYVLPCQVCHRLTLDDWCSDYGQRMLRVLRHSEARCRQIYMYNTSRQSAY